jgi:hypothetical protein
MPMGLHLRDMTFGMSDVALMPSSFASLRARRTPQLTDRPRSVGDHTVPTSMFKRFTCSLLHDQMVARRRENANIHDNNPGRRKSLVPTAGSR